MRSGWGWLFCVAGLLLASAAGHAQDGGADGAAAPASSLAVPTAPEGQVVDIQRAREAYAEGQALFRLRDFRGAEAAFRAAFSHQPNPVVLLSIAEAQQRMGRWQEAAASLRRYLNLQVEAPGREAVSKRIAALEQPPGKVRIATDPGGAEVMLNGVSTGERTPAELRLPPGVHQLAFLLQGREPAIASVVVESNSEREVSVSLPPFSTEVAEQPADVPTMPVVVEGAGGAGATVGGATVEGAGAPVVTREASTPVVAGVDGATTDPAFGIQAPDAPSEAAQRAQIAQLRGDRVTFWTSVGIGTAGLVAGGVLGGLATLEKQRFDDAPSEASADRGERLALFADFGFGVAIAAAVTAWVVASAPEQAAPGLASVHPTVGNGFAGVSTRVLF